MFNDSEIRPSELTGIALIGYILLYQKSYNTHPKLNQPPIINVDGIRNVPFEWQITDVSWKNIKMYEKRYGKEVTLDQKYSSEDIVIKHQERDERIRLQISSNKIIDATLKNQYYFRIELISSDVVCVTKVNTPEEKLIFRFQ